MSSSEKDEEEMFLNPGKIEELQRKKEAAQEEKKQWLLNEKNIMMKEKKMYDEGERRLHKDILPAKDRIGEYKRKSFGKLF